MSTWDRHCHDGPLEVFKIGGSTIWAGSEVEIGSKRDWGLVISLCKSFTAKGPILSTNKLADKILPANLRKLPDCPHLTVDWTDRAAGPVPGTFWDDLVVFLKTSKLNLKVGLHCQGGHGRTGTALAILAAKAGKLSKKKDPLAYIRERYCIKAGESDTQLDYIEAMTGFKVRVGISESSSLGGSVFPPSSPALSAIAARVSSGTGHDPYFQNVGPVGTPSAALTEALSVGEDKEAIAEGVFWPAASTKGTTLAKALLTKAQEEEWSLDELRALDGMDDEEIASFYGLDFEGSSSTVDG